MKTFFSYLLYFLFGLTASLALFGMVKAAWNTPVTGGSTFLSQPTWNDRDNKITELENRMNTIYNLTPGLVCGISKGGRNCSTDTRQCRPADPPPTISWYGADMLNPGNCPLNMGGI